MEELRREVTRADEAATAAAQQASRAEAATMTISQDVAALRREVQTQLMTPVVLPGMSAPASPARSISSTATAPAPSDARLKAAVRTLSDGYQSLHRAMSMMYDEQSEVAERVTAVGKAAVASSLAGVEETTSSSKINAVNSAAVGSKIFRSHPVSLASLVAEEEKDARNNKKKTPTVSQEVAELHALMAAQAADASRQQRRAEAMEAELAEMKKLLCALAPAHVRNQLQPISEVNATTSAVEEEFFEPSEDTEEELASTVDTTTTAVPAMPALKEEIAEKSNSRVALCLVCNEITGSVAATITVPYYSSSATTLSKAQQHCRITRGVVGVASKEAFVSSSSPAVYSDGETIPASWTSVN
jgi:hypothetical protein